MFIINLKWSYICEKLTSFPQSCNAFSLAAKGVKFGLVREEAGFHEMLLDLVCVVFPKNYDSDKTALSTQSLQQKVARSKL